MNRLISIGTLIECLLGIVKKNIYILTFKHLITMSVHF